MIFYDLIVLFYFLLLPLDRERNIVNESNDLSVVYLRVEPVPTNIREFYEKIKGHFPDIGFVGKTDCSVTFVMTNTTEIESYTLELPELCKPYKVSFSHDLVLLACDFILSPTPDAMILSALRHLGAETLADMGISNTGGLPEPIVEEVLDIAYDPNDPQKTLTDAEKLLFLVPTLHKTLEELQAQRSIIIHDPYLFNPAGIGSVEYAQAFKDIFGDTIKRCSEVILMYDDSKKDTGCESEIKRMIGQLRSGKNITVHKIDSKCTFHDRFWIVDDRVGMSIGTSLNGMGKRISLLCPINEADMLKLLDYIKTKPTLTQVPF